MQESIFTKIIKGEIPCEKVYEGEKTIAFLDIYPAQPGLTLVVSKLQVEHFEALPDEDYIALWQTVKKVAQKQRQVFPNKYKIGIHVEGLDVPHVHVKVFPFDTAAEFRSPPDRSGEPDHAALAEMAKRLAF